MSYLGICRNLEALGEVVLNYFTSTFELFYDELLRYLVTTKNVQFSCLQGLLKLQGKDFIKAVVKKYSENANKESNIFTALYKAQAKNKKVVLDTRLLDIALRYRNADAITEREFKNILKAFIDENISVIKKKLMSKIDL